MSDIQEYFQRVVTLSPGTYFSVHYKTPGGIPGKAYYENDFAAAEKDARAWAKRYDVYLAMGAQKECGPANVAIRQKHNTIFARNLYMDIDVKSKAYATTAEAAKDFRDFLISVGLPPPTVMVLSGTGGFHNYFVLSELITLDEHFKLASQLSLAAREFGLKFDSACTMDPTRLLRVPDTLNYKTTPPSSVKLVHVGAEIDLDIMRNALSRFVVSTPKSNPKSGSPNDDLRTGQIYKVPTIDQVADVCPFIKETLDSGGTNLVDDPQWHAMAALSCHCVDPSATIHRLCSKSPYYKYDDSEKKLAQAQAYRSQNPQLGPPKCVSIQNVGAPHCATCPHFALGTTPLAVPFLQPAQVNGVPVSSDDLPPGYFRNEYNWICLEETAEDEAKAERTIVFPYAIAYKSGYLEGNKQLTFTTWQGEEETKKTFETTAFSDDVSFKKAMLAEFMPININVSKGRNLFMEYIRLLQTKKETMIRVPALGWTLQSGVWGFAYDGYYITPQGKFRCQHPDRGIAEYKAVGDDGTIWRNMAKLVLTPDRPDLMVLVAASFAAPFVEMSGQNGYLIGAHSIESGIGKTTSLTLAQSVWAPPVVGGFTDTVNYTIDKCASLRDLPVIFDEVKGDQQMIDFTKLVFQITQGKEKGRSGRDGKMRETRTWHTNITYASNSSIVSAVADQTQGTHASVYRVFEFQALALPNKNQVFTTDVAEHTIKLRSNYGGIGKIYAEHLGQNRETLEKQFRDFHGSLAKQLQAQDPERCWIAAMATVIFGARVAVKLGLAPFDLPKMYEFMKKEFLRMRNDQRLSIGDYTNPDAIYSELALLLAEKWRNVIITDKAWTMASRPPRNYAKILSPQHQLADNSRDEIGIQISGDPLTLRVRETFLGKWCRENKRQKSALTQAMLKLQGVTRSKSRLASGTSLAGQDEYILIIPVTGTPMEDRCEYAIQYKDLKP